MFRQFALTIDLPPGDYQVTDVVSWPARLAAWLARPVTVRIPHLGRLGFPARWRVLVIVLLVLAAVLWGEVTAASRGGWAGEFFRVSVFGFSVFGVQLSVFRKGVGA